MNREIQLLNELREYLVDNTSDTRFVWFSGEEDVQFWESEGGPIFRALFRGGPRRALLGIGRNRYFNREHEFINIYIRPVFELGVGYRENHARQLFEVCTGNTPDSEQKFEGVGFEGGEDARPSEGAPLWGPTGCLGCSVQSTTRQPCAPALVKGLPPPPRIAQPCRAPVRA